MPRGVPKDGTWRGREPLGRWVERMQAEAPACACGCGEPIRIRRSHRCHGIPRFIHGHQARALRNRYAGVDVWVEDNQGRHLCACGCGGAIEIRPYHHATGVPRYLPNHGPCPVLGHGPEHPTFIRDRTAVKYRGGRGFTPRP